jgi:quinolinate synthase
MQEELLIAKNEVQEKGFLDVGIDPMLDLFAEIERLKKEKNAIILAHLYRIYRTLPIMLATALALPSRRPEQTRT